MPSAGVLDWGNEISRAYGARNALCHAHQRGRRAAEQGD
jgi:hypothetical protein